MPILSNSSTGNRLLAPGDVVRCHLDDQLPHLNANTRSTVRVFRSIKSPSCFRRNRFSAATAVLSLKHSFIKLNPFEKNLEDDPNCVQKRLHDSINSSSLRFLLES